MSTIVRKYTEYHRHTIGPADLILERHGRGFKVVEATVMWRCDCGVSGVFDSLLSLLLATNDMNFNKQGTEVSWKYRKAQDFAFYPEVKAVIRASHPPMDWND